MPLYHIKNMTLAAIVTQNAAGKGVTIGSRSVTKLPVDLSEKTIKRLRRTRGVIVTPTELDLGMIKDDVVVEPDEGRKVDTSRSTELSKSDLAKELLNEYRDENRSPPLEYHVFVARAKEIVGEEKWPNGTPKKSAVISLLEQVIEE